ncbi:MAG TPA: hypothetical protein VFJ90_16245 [Candidatus Didemnitutus sp.]|nr:hypothetical protein [Candidatus Didemnitutus sp.]
MRIMRLSAIIALGLALGYAFSDGAEEAKKPEGQKAKCCQKAEKDGKKCEHSCCVDAAKEGKNCEKCGGTNK